MEAFPIRFPAVYLCASLGKAKRAPRVCEGFQYYPGGIYSGGSFKTSPPHWIPHSSSRDAECSGVDTVAAASQREFATCSILARCCRCIDLVKVMGAQLLWPTMSLIVICLGFLAGANYHSRRKFKDRVVLTLISKRSLLLSFLWVPENSSYL